MIETTEQEGVAILRMADGRANAMSIDFCAEITAKFEEISPARAVVLSGSGRIFSAGVDLLRLLDGGGAYIRQFPQVLTAKATGKKSREYFEVTSADKREAPQVKFN